MIILFKCNDYVLNCLYLLLKKYKENSFKNATYRSIIRKNLIINRINIEIRS